MGLDTKSGLLHGRLRTIPDMPPGSEHPRNARNAGSPAFGDPTVVIDRKKSKVWQPPTPQDLSNMLQQYEVDMVLGRGGMGAVYKGTHKTLDRVVAIKILPPEMDDLDTSYAERFKNEARAMARLTHPNIVSVYDFGETATGLLYFVMEYIEGLDVQRMLREQGHLQSEHVKNIIDQVCDALDYAHEKKIIHRDIKPANIMVGYDGKVKVADFGLAKINQGSEVALTGNNTLLGTLHYMAPESLMLGTTVDHRADIYAMGVMLYQMLTGKLPQGMFEMPSKKVPGLDPKFDVIVANALREDRDQRYQTVAQMRSDFEEVMTPQTTQKQTRRSRTSNRLGRYKIATDETGKPVMLGAGSAGKTYKANHSLLGTTVALKVIHEALAYDAEVRQRFVNEAKAIAKLKHPHIAQLVDCDEDDGALFCAIEYCDGGDLEKLVSSRGALPELTVLQFGRQAAKALAYVHDEGFLHRDLKPSNLMLSMVPGTNTAHVKLIDFGLVKALGQTSGLTRKGQFRGTLLYTSPEQLRDEELDERTDIFSLGMTLWFLLIGRQPLENNSSEITQRRLSGKSHAEMLPKSVHPAIRALLTQMLHPEVKRRARNMHVVLAGMDECLNMMRRTTGTTTRRRPTVRPVSDGAVETSDVAPTPAQSAPSPASNSVTASSSTDRRTSAVQAPPQDGGFNEEDELQTIAHRPRMTEPVLEMESQVHQSQTKHGSAPALLKFDTTLRTKFELMDEQQGVHSEVGTTYRARRLSNGDIVQVTLMHPEVANDKGAVKELRNLHKKTAECPGDFLLRPLTMIRFLDHAVLVEEFVEGPRVLTVLRAKQRLSLLDALPVFQQIAEACDLASAAGIDSLDLAPHHVVLQLRKGTRSRTSTSEEKNLLSRPLRQWPPFVIRLGLSYPGAEDDGDLPWLFSRLAYHLLSGMPPHASAFSSRQAYVAVAGLSEDANRLLAKILAREIRADGCMPLLRTLLQLENIATGMQ
jgi:serine/threonine protein kinase